MNLFLSTLGKNPLGVFFDDKIDVFKEVYFERNDFFVDVLSQYSELKKVKNIFYISGPASFTALRNMSVFINIYAHNSLEKINIYSIPAQDFFQIVFPYSQANILSAGRRESFIFEHTKDYVKHKNSELIDYLQKKNIETLGGEFSSQFLELSGNNASLFTFSFPEPQKDVFLEILKKREHWKTNSAIIDYGALPNIG